MNSKYTKKSHKLKKKKKKKTILKRDNKGKVIKKNNNTDADERYKVAKLKNVDIYNRR